MPSEREPSDEVLELAAADSRPENGFDTEELDRLLDLAGEVQGRIDKLSRSSRYYFIWLLAVGALVTWLLTGDLNPYFIGPVIVNLVNLLLFTALLKGTNRALGREERKLEEVLDIAREVAQVMAHNDLVRPLTKARIRMRISDYPLARSNSWLPPFVRAILGSDL